MIIWHVYSVSCATPNGEPITEIVVAMNTGEARDKVTKQHHLDQRFQPAQVVWHVHELTRFNA